ncbi:MAG: methionine adenosyltransferase [Thermaurantiacus tibetensis]|uniref:methionine adenosyltransferase n=1 Tax=Thermaurantiacus tibetensis TaxID=2759035 RepID=UPI00189036B7|nr:methionine adenosyltransferase [Thermaurantiacus tibetensis]
MPRSHFTFTSESVSEGHPDKVADQISDAVVDLFLSRDPVARVACETLVTTQRIVLAGEVRCNPDVFPTLDEIEKVARATVRRIGYEQHGFHWQTADFACHLHGQSAHIAMGVDESGNKDEGAGDQGIMFGYATDETPEFMPATLYYAHRILERLAQDRHNRVVDFLEPDAKSQVTLAYENEVPVGATALVVSTQHTRELSNDAGQKRLRDYVMTVLEDVLPKGWVPNDSSRIFVNPTGLFEIGGPDGDAGLTGRKIIVDTYGGASPHGGGAFSGKDPTKVDRSAAYVARYLAKNIVAAGLARRVTIQLSYAIGVAEPLSILVDTHGTGTVPEDRIEAALPRLVRLTPKGIRTHLGLNRPIYERTAAYGHFGRTPDAEGGFTWERTDLVDALRDAL